MKLFSEQKSQQVNKRSIIVRSQNQLAGLTDAVFLTSPLNGIKALENSFRCHIDTNAPIPYPDIGTPCMCSPKVSQDACSKDPLGECGSTSIAILLYFAD